MAGCFWGRVLLGRGRHRWVWSRLIMDLGSRIPWHLPITSKKPKWKSTIKPVAPTITLAVLIKSIVWAPCLAAPFPTSTKGILRKSNRCRRMLIWRSTSRKLILRLIYKCSLNLTEWKKTSRNVKKRGIRLYSRVTLCSKITLLILRRSTRTLNHQSNERNNGFKHIRV